MPPLESSFAHAAPLIDPDLESRRNPLGEEGAEQQALDIEESIYDWRALSEYARGQGWSEDIVHFLETPQLVPDKFDAHGIAMAKVRYLVGNLVTEGQGEAVFSDPSLSPEMSYARNTLDMLSQTNSLFHWKMLQLQTGEARVVAERLQ